MSDDGGCINGLVLVGFIMGLVKIFYILRWWIFGVLPSKEDLDSLTEPALLFWAVIFGTFFGLLFFIFLLQDGFSSATLVMGLLFFFTLILIGGSISAWRHLRK